MFETMAMEYLNQYYDDIDEGRCEKLSIDELDDILERIGAKIRNMTKHGSAATYEVV